MRTIKLSPSQAKIIAHRLEVPGCIAESETDREGGDPWTSDEVEEMATRMCEELERGGAIILATDATNPNEESLRCTIATNCMDCSTYYAYTESYGECDPYHQLELSRIERSLEALQRKFREVGLEVDVVNW